MSALAEVLSELGHTHTFYRSEDEPIDYNAFDIVVLDTYQVDDAYISNLHIPNRVLVCYDDNALYNYSCDILINANLYAKTLKYKIAGKTPMMLLGGKYALLRREFRESKPIDIKSNANRIFVCFGGTDSRNMTPPVIKSLQSINGVYLSVVLGKYTRCDEEVKQIAGKNVTVYKAPKSIYEIMRDCDIAVTSSGSIVYELAAIGMPSITIIQADNQIHISRFLAEECLMESAGDWQSPDYINLNKIVISLLSDLYRRKTESHRLINSIDKNGAVNVADEILKYTYERY